MAPYTSALAHQVMFAYRTTESRATPMATLIPLQQQYYDDTLLFDGLLGERSLELSANQKYSSLMHVNPRPASACYQNYQDTLEDFDIGRPQSQGTSSIIDLAFEALDNFPQHTTSSLCLEHDNDAVDIDFAGLLYWSEAEAMYMKYRGISDRTAAMTSNVYTINRININKKEAVPII